MSLTRRLFCALATAVLHIRTADCCGRPLRHFAARMNGGMSALRDVERLVAAAPTPNSAPDWSRVSLTLISEATPRLGDRLPATGGDRRRDPGAGAGWS
jgi:hypothetical protein